MPAKAPKGLGPRGRRFLRDTLAVFNLERDELELLAEICRVLDQIDALAGALDADRRRQPAGPAHAELPVHLREYRGVDDWPDQLTAAGLLDPPPDEDWAFGVDMWRDIYARRLWREAGRAWLAEHGHDPARWYQLTHPTLTAGRNYQPPARPNSRSWSHP